jgi:hypothetical protein
MKTTKKLLAVAAFCIAALASQAQSFGDNKVLSFGVGFGGSAFMYSGSDATLPPLQVSLEFPMSEKIGVGGLLGYAGSKWEGFGFKVTYSYILVGGRAYYHLVNTDKMDAYGALTLGYNIASSKISGAGLGTAASASGLLWGGVVGMRYYLSDKFAVNGELGYGLAILTVGLSMKL